MAGKPTIDRRLLRELCDGERTYLEIAEILGCKRKSVSALVRELGLPRRAMGDRKADRTGTNNPAYISGRRIDHDGYVLVSAPKGHPHARIRHDRKIGMILEHRLLMEGALGRYLDPVEVVDHRDGLTLHNDLGNLRLFACNADHLKATLNDPPQHSAPGYLRMSVSRLARKDLALVDTYGLRKKRGDARLRQILLAALQFGIDSPFLLGSHAHLSRKQIDYSTHTRIELAYQALLSRYEQDLI